MQIDSLNEYIKRKEEEEHIDVNMSKYSNSKNGAPETLSPDK
jgi:hypothetical protein